MTTPTTPIEQYITDEWVVVTHDNAYDLADQIGAGSWDTIDVTHEWDDEAEITVTYTDENDDTVTDVWTIQPRHAVDYWTEGRLWIIDGATETLAALEETLATIDDDTDLLNASNRVKAAQLLVARAAASRRDAVRQARDRGVSVIDIAKELGVARDRVYVLLRHD